MRIVIGVTSTDSLLLMSVGSAIAVEKLNLNFSSFLSLQNQPHNIIHLVAE